MSDKKYSLESVKPKIECFLNLVARRGGFEWNFTVTEGETRHPDFENPEIMVRFGGPDVDLLLANKAELLLSLEQLTQETLAMAPEDHSRMCFDANDYRMLRIEELRLSAVTAADKVKRGGVPFRFNPMNSRERRIIHLALTNETAVRSESIGMGPQRQVVIFPAGMPSSAVPPLPPGPPPRPAGAGRDSRDSRDSRGGRNGRDGRRGGPRRGR